MKRNLEIIFVFLFGILLGLAIFGTVQSHTEPNITEKPAPEVEYVYIETEKVKEVPVYVEVEVPVYVEPDFYRTLSSDDEFYLMDLAMRESESEGVNGMLWVMYCAECRREAFGGSYYDIWASDAFKASMNRAGLTPNENCLKALELFKEGWIPKPLWFRLDDFHSFGTPLAKVGAHYFSSK